MLIYNWKFVGFSLIYLNHFIEFGMMGSIINSIVKGLAVTFLTLLNYFQTANIKGLFSMVNLQPGNCSELVCYKVQF